ncbi:hypothetical protein N5079_19820 [Planotetraspora sp. A-T 1434]|uniref:hypothetical protein n=1 Tax=Planotetraspora sp. A-T 1434 TaxID=2979219 RepID=UPI0021C21029|nr:hypothetical protein [Planotetraspora sp. A-T 1434]MCT9932453.1 hypothetical protein [Planotetraspora sp. A-T 1434]
MPRIVIGDESAEFDLSRLALHEGIAIQDATGWRVTEVGDAMAKGDLKAVAALAWIALRRMGKDVTFADITEGRYPIDIMSIRIETDEEPDPTPAAGANASP